LLILFIGVYLVLRAWYNKRYENYLFKNKNDLYNIATYITTAKRRGIPDKEIIENLKKSGWNSEQIRYAMRKYAGKKTGMPI
jgi:phage anti-repressor protein